LVSNHGEALTHRGNDSNNILGLIFTTRLTYFLGSI